MRRTTVESAVNPGGEGASSGSRGWYSVAETGSGRSGATAKSALPTVESVLESAGVEDGAHIAGVWLAGA